MLFEYLFENVVSILIVILLPSWYEVNLNISQFPLKMGRKDTTPFSVSAFLNPLKNGINGYTQDFQDELRSIQWW